MSEFGGCSTAGKHIKLAMTGVRHLDHRLFQSRLNAVCSCIQKLDTISVWGQRSILISQYRNLLQGFNLEMGTLFDSIVKHPLDYNINRIDQSAFVNIPPLYPNIGLYVPGKFSFFRLIAVLGIVPDMKYNAKLKKYQPLNPDIQLRRVQKMTDWFGVATICEEQTIDMQIDGETNMTDNDSLILSIGIEFGIPLTASLIQTVNYAGAAKILALA